MRALKIEGGHKLNGTIEIEGAKNSTVALIPAMILSHGTTILESVPELSDVDEIIEILHALNVKTSFENGVLTTDSSNIINAPLTEGPVQKFRASYYFMGALLGRFGEARVGLPGGCFLGPRPIEQHIKGFEALGATLTIVDGYYHLKAEQLKGTTIYLDMPSVGATINIILAAVYADGVTTIENAAKEPEIIDLVTLLTNMGAQIRGAGTDTIRITGVAKLDSCRHQVVPDRITAGTYMIAAALCGGEVRINNIIPKHLDAVIAKLTEAGVNMTIGDDYAVIRGSESFKPLSLTTQVFPGFPTDLQQPFTILLTQANGTSFVHDTIFSDRFEYLKHLTRMQANVNHTPGGPAVITGITKLTGARVEATDLRAGAALILAGLIAQGETILTKIEHVERGYANIVENFQNIGAKIEIIEI